MELIISPIETYVYNNIIYLSFLYQKGDVLKIIMAFLKMLI